MNNDLLDDKVHDAISLLATEINNSGTDAQEKFLKKGVAFLAEYFTVLDDEMKNSTKKCWIIQYSHRHGVDVWPVFSTKEPHYKEIIEELDDWEGNERDDEYIEIVGPFDPSSGERVAK